MSASTIDGMNLLRPLPKEAKPRWRRRANDCIGKKLAFICDIFLDVQTIVEIWMRLIWIGRRFYGCRNVFWIDGAEMAVNGALEILLMGGAGLNGLIDVYFPK